MYGIKSIIFLPVVPTPCMFDPGLYVCFCCHTTVWTVGPLDLAKRGEQLKTAIFGF